MRYETEVSSGKYIDIVSPNWEDIDIKDIATHLSGQRRFNGASPVSVAEHSLIVCDMVRNRGQSLEDQFGALMHDGHETYLGDLSSQVKAAIGVRYYDLVAGFDYVICRKFNIKLDNLTSKVVKHADLLALRVEAHWHMMSAGEGHHWERLPEASPELMIKYRPRCLAPDKAYLEFIGRYNEYARVFDLPYAL